MSHHYSHFSLLLTTETFIKFKGTKSLNKIYLFDQLEDGRLGRLRYDELQNEYYQSIALLKQKFYVVTSKPILVQVTQNKFFFITRFLNYRAHLI